MPHKSFLAPLVASILVFTAGCASTSPQPGPSTADEVPELTLNLPQAQTDCVPAPTRDFTFLERGYDALVVGDYIEAVQYFQRYQRLEKSAAADWEAGIAIAYASTLPRSPFYDPEAAQKSYNALKALPQTSQTVHTQALMMRDALETFVAQQRHIDDLENNNSILREDLEKREEALKRLRELTLGQRGARQ